MCEQCATDNKVTDSRNKKRLMIGGQELNVRGVRRRRECLACGERFTTYELSKGILIDLIGKGQSVQEMPDGLLTRIAELEKRVRDVELKQAFTF